MRLHCGNELAVLSEQPLLGVVLDDLAGVPLLQVVDDRQVVDVLAVRGQELVPAKVVQHVALRQILVQTLPRKDLVFRSRSLLLKEATATGFLTSIKTVLLLLFLACATTELLLQTKGNGLLHNSLSGKFIPKQGLLTELFN